MNKILHSSPLPNREYNLQYIPCKSRNRARTNYIAAVFVTSMNLTSCPAIFQTSSAHSPPLPHYSRSNDGDRVLFHVRRFADVSHYFPNQERVTKTAYMCEERLAISLSDYMKSLSEPVRAKAPAPPPPSSPSCFRYLITLAPCITYKYYCRMHNETRQLSSRMMARPMCGKEIVKGQRQYLDISVHRTENCRTILAISNPRLVQHGRILLASVSCGLCLENSRAVYHPTIVVAVIRISYRTTFRIFHEKHITGVLLCLYGQAKQHGYICNTSSLISCSSSGGLLPGSTTNLVLPRDLTPCLCSSWTEFIHSCPDSG